MPKAAAGGDLVVLGEFGRAHGLRGEVRLKSHTADPLAVGRYGPLLLPDGRTVTLTALRQAAGDQPDLLVVRVEGIGDRDGAERLNRLRVGVPRERLGPADEDEFFLHDLIGLRCVSPDGAPVGEVVGVPDYGGGELLEIAPAGGGRTALLPFTRRFVPTVDVAGGRVVVDPPADLFADPGKPPSAGRRRDGEEPVSDAPASCRPGTA